MRHIEANWCKNWGAGELKKHLWWCSWCTYQEEFQDHLTMMEEENKEAGEDLLNRYPAESWCRAYFDTVCKNWQVENNVVESFNNWVLDARFKPIIKMLEDIRVKVMTMLGEHESDVMNWTGEFSPQTMLLYNQFLKIAQKCTVYFNGDDGYEVAHGVDRHSVNIELKRCTCRTWDLIGIPCPHAIRALLYRKINPLTRIHWWYSKEAALLTYSHKLQPVRGEIFWKIEPAHAIEPPKLVKLAGRPRIKRVREKNECVNRQGVWSESRKGRVMTCSTCGEPGHNARGCQKVRYLTLLC